MNGDDTSFEQRVREILYANVMSTADSPVMQEIRQLCFAPGKSPNLDSIITYNFDDVLECCLRAFSTLEALIEEIFAVGQQARRDCLPIYHVHGYLPRSGNLTPAHRISSGDRTTFITTS